MRIWVQPFFRYNHQQFIDGAVPAVQIPASTGIGKQGVHSFLMRGQLSMQGKRPIMNFR